MKIKTIENLNIYDDFVKKSPYNHYRKYSNWANLKKTSNMKPYFLGFYDEELIGTAMIFKFNGIIPYMYIPTGLCIDYSNLDILNEALDLLKDFAKKEKVSFLRIDPLVIRVSRDIDGNQIDGINNEFVTETLINKGFKHKGYGYGYDGSLHNRFTLIVDIDKDIETLRSNYTKQRQTALNRHEVIGLYTRLGNIDDIKYLMEFEKELASMQGFKPHSKEFFTNIINKYKNNHRLYITEINLEHMIEGISKELKSKKYAKDKEARLAKERELNQANILKEEHGPLLVVAAGLFLYGGNRSWDLYAYNRKSCNFLKPVDNLHYFAMQDLQSLGVKYYDMCGFSGSTSKDDPYYGLYNYKKSFNPEFIEWIGEFDYIIDKNKYKLLLNTKKGFRRIRRKLNSIIYKKD